MIAELEAEDSDFEEDLASRALQATRVPSVIAPSPRSTPGKSFFLVIFLYSSVMVVASPVSAGASLKRVESSQAVRPAQRTSSGSPAKSAPSGSGAAARFGLKISSSLNRSGSTKTSVKSSSQRPSAEEMIDKKQDISQLSRLTSNTLAKTALSTKSTEQLRQLTSLKDAALEKVHAVSHKRPRHDELQSDSVIADQATTSTAQTQTPKKRIALSGVAPATFKVLIQYLYTDECYFYPLSSSFFEQKIASDPGSSPSTLMISG